MKSKLNFTKPELLKLSFLFVALGLLTIYSKSISGFLIESYNDKIEFLANHTVGNSNMLRY